MNNSGNGHIRINPGGGDPFVSVYLGHSDDAGSYSFANIYLAGVTPDHLRAMADELEALLAQKEPAA